MIHPTAIIDASAAIASNVEIGAYSVVGPGVTIGEGCVIAAHVVLTGPTRVGCRNKIYPFASIGADPQDKKYNGEETHLEIGDDNTIREYVTINRGTAQDGSITRVGHRNWIMAYVHIAHDCLVGNDVIFANNTTLAGHVRIDDFVVLGGSTLVHQFCRLGEHVFTSYAARINKDVPPFVKVSEGKAKPRGINREGLMRRGYDEKTIQLLKDSYRVLYRSDLALTDAVALLREMEETCEPVRRLRIFIEQSQRSIIR
ncbi:MAG: acyl-ACP--UDP-N-acetylglucosamine O-acyltransferase [Gammaproteobacteria bacterium]